MKIAPNFSDVSPDIAPPAKPKEMISVRREGTQTVVRINSSSLSTILTCMRKSQLSLFRGLKARSESPATLFGSAIHKGLEVFYAEPKENRYLPADLEEKGRIIAALPPEEGEHFLFRALRAFVKAAEPLQMLPDTDKRSVANGIWLLTNYFKTYIYDPYEVYCDESGPVTERTFELVLDESPTLKIILFGTIDVVLRYLVNDSILPTDHKTFSRGGSDFFNRLRPNHQYTGYLLGAQQVLGLETDSFLVNGIEVKAKPLTPRGKGANFTRQVTKRNAQDIADFKEAVKWAVEAYLRASDSEVWPIGDVNACTMYGGCTFLEVCQAPSQLRENLIDAKFYSPGV